ncbi:MAG: alpha-amylase family glycosyl hydrolase [Cyclonatronaceae bacterium]
MFRNGDRENGYITTTSHLWGARQGQHSCTFRVYCPRAEHVKLVLFQRYSDLRGEHHAMERLDDGSWILELSGEHTGKYYAFRVEHVPHESGLLDPPALIADPWATQVMTVNHYQQHPKSRITGEEVFDWEGDTFVTPSEQRDLIIYEAHVRDLTAHPSSGARAPGTYAGVIEKGITGGINHLKRLGVTAVELLPVQKFAGFEPPFEKKTPEGYYNTWNPYSRNHWGYMTSFFFAPETMYATDGSNRAGERTGSPEKASRELKEMVKALHREGIAVIMDVVYNHASHFDQNPLKYLDKEKFFRTDAEGNLTSKSGCGNDLRTESPHIRGMILSSIKWWMQEYHIDGFRFDLANLIDRETIAEIREQAQEINPNVVLIAEPWGGGYDPTGFSGYGWSAWNDQLRNGVKGIDPIHTPGFIFGKWHYETSRKSLENYIRGTLLPETNGRFHHQEHALNYLESHDGYTLGDFIRIALDPGKKDARFPDKKRLIALNEQELKCARLAALFLLTAQGIPMIHSGQEWGRSKWIVPANPRDPHAGKLDHNSYEKDNATNHLDYSEIKANEALFRYYRNLIRLRRENPQLRLARAEEIRFHAYDDALHITFEIHSTQQPGQCLLISLNGNPDTDHQVNMPDGKWEQIGGATEIHPHAPRPVNGNEVIVPATSGIILRQLSD